MAKRIQGFLFMAIFRIMGIVVLLLGIRMVGEGICNYIEEHQQQDWVQTTGWVTEVESGYSGIRQGRSIRYDITYAYEAQGARYTGRLYNRSRYMDPGEPVVIKYDPENPADSTDILSPSLYNLVVFLLFGAALTGAGFLLSGSWALVSRIRTRGKPLEPEVLPSEEYVDGRPPKG